MSSSSSSTQSHRGPKRARDEEEDANQHEEEEKKEEEDQERVSVLTTKKKQKVHSIQAEWVYDIDTVVDNGRYETIEDEMNATLFLPIKVRKSRMGDLHILSPAEIDIIAECITEGDVYYPDPVTGSVHHFIWLSDFGTWRNMWGDIECSTIEMLRMPIFKGVIKWKIGNHEYKASYYNEYGDFCFTRDGKEHRDRDLPSSGRSTSSTRVVYNSVPFHDTEITPSSYQWFRYLTTVEQFMQEYDVPRIYHLSFRYSWIEDGHPHRDGNKPQQINILVHMGRICVYQEEWAIRGQIHRIDPSKPSSVAINSFGCIATYVQNGSNHSMRGSCDVYKGTPFKGEEPVYSLYGKKTTKRTLEIVRNKATAFIRGLDRARAIVIKESLIPYLPSMLIDQLVLPYVEYY